MSARWPVYILVFGLSSWVFPQTGGPAMATEPRAKRISLPAPKLLGAVSLEEALRARRSEREYSTLPLKLGEVSQLLWSAQGLTHGDSERTAPSAGALYPLEIYVAADRVDGLDPGVYHYLPRDHALAFIKDGARGEVLARAALNQDWIERAGAIIVVAADFERTTRKYGDRGIGYVQMEAGFVAQNVSLQVVTLGLGTTVVGAFDDEAVKDVLGLPADQEPLALLPVGRPK